jgi:hypothetical protein
VSTTAPSNVTTQVAEETGKGELIFNFMGLVWGTNDAKSGGMDWMSK